ncbi:MAG: alpha/beta hydrolase [Actinomycetota bacterium]|nr:alpha/beta hydrolase [Actinomycetota bacterium]
MPSRLIGSFVATPSGNVHVRVDGPLDGPPLLLLHGFCGSMNWFDRVVRLLEDTFRVIRVDLLGHGRTGGAAVDAGEQTRMVEAVLEHLGVSGVVVVGHSFGADVAVELAEKSDRVDALVIITQAPDYTDATLPRGAALMTTPVLGRVLYGIGAPLSSLVNATFSLMRGYPARRDLIALGFRDFRALNFGMFKVILIARRDRLAVRPLDDQIRDAQKPTLAILGALDAFYGARAADRYEAAGARVEILPESGHSPIVDQPGRTASLIRAFAVEKGTLP